MGEIGDEHDGPLRLAAEALAELAMVKAICGVLAAEIARLDPSPGKKLGEITSLLQGTADGLVKVAGTDSVTKTITWTVEYVVQIAERALELHERPS